MTTLTFKPLTTLEFRSDESKIINFTLKINGSLQDMSGWTAKLVVKGTKPSGTFTKTITQASTIATQGRIDADQVTNPGEFFFTVLSSDWSALVATAPATKTTLEAYIQFDDGSTSPPNVFSNVEFKIVLKTA